MAQKEIIKILQGGGIGILATDTLYGIVCRALSRESVKKIYEIRGRSPDKPLIILISSVEDLKLFDIEPTSEEALLAKKYWPGKVSVILPSHSPAFEYLHRGTQTLGFRLPNDASLIQILRETGPLVAPSANKEGRRPAFTIGEAKAYFADAVDFYEDSGRKESAPSTVLKIAGKKVTLVRKGAVEFTN